MAQSTHQRLYPQLYTADGILKSSLTPKVDFGGSGTGVDSLNLAGPNGKGTGMDLANGGIDSLFTEVVKEQPELSEFYDDQILREVRKPAPKKTKEVKPNAPGGTGKESTADEEKDAKGMLQKLFEKYDLVSLGNSIGRGEGLLPAIEAQDAAIKQEAKDLAAAKVTAAKTEADISYKLALAQQALREKNPEFIRTLTAMGIDPTDPQALELYKDKISKSSSIDPMMLMLFKNQGLITDAQFDDAINSSIGVATTPGVEPVNLTTQD